ncbi:MAG: hypothetical protein IAE80_01820 [Anaerolinea sp.]|nr:hypothetical protein [Anaerolinea sp.]
MGLALWIAVLAVWALQAAALAAAQVAVQATAQRRVSPEAWAELHLSSPMMGQQATLAAETTYSARVAVRWQARQ